MTLIRRAAAASAPAALRLQRTGFLLLAAAWVLGRAAHSAPVAAVRRTAMSVSPLGCIGIPVHADDEHAVACRAYFESKHDECININQAITTAKCVIARFQGDADEQAGMCACMEYYEALALSVLASATSQHHHDGDTGGNDDACGQCYADCHADHDADWERLPECNEACDEHVCGHHNECNACHAECIEGDEGCHTICDGSTFCSDDGGDDDDFEFDEGVLHECHDECDDRICSGFDQGEGADVNIGESSSGAHEADEEQEQEQEHDFADDECYICHTDCVKEIFGSGVWGSGSAMMPSPPPFDNGNLQCHDQCEEQFPMTAGDWDFGGSASSEACHECHEECSETVDKGTEGSTVCHLQCDTSICMAGFEAPSPAPSPGPSPGPSPDQGYHTDGTAAAQDQDPAAARPRRSTAATTAEERRRRALSQTNQKAAAGGGGGARSRRYIENMQCHMDCDGEDWDDVYGSGDFDDGATIGDSAVDGLLDEINSAITIATSTATTSAGGSGINVLALAVAAVVAAGLA